MSTATAPAPTITTEHVEHYREHGYVIIPKVISAEHLDLLRRHCQAAMQRTDAEMDKQGTDVLGINRRGNRYFSCQPSYADPDIYDFVYSQVMEQAVRALIGETVHVFWEQYVVKGRESGMKFSWHQDSGYVSADTPHEPYLTCWCALDDMSEANGTAYILPTSRLGIRRRVEHIRDSEINDLVGYFGKDPGDPIICPAGSIAFFSSVTFHRSGWNRSDQLRRAYLIQYSGELIQRKTDGKMWGRSECFLDKGKRVAHRGTGVAD
jgi:ectoine hydroxylase-related dioxygenase (phytanoyl-CoA dioxygenase family)